MGCLSPTAVFRGRPPLMAAAQSEFPCSRCGAKLLFAPGTLHLKCPYCLTENEIPPGASLPGAGSETGTDDPPHTLPAIEELDFHAQIAGLTTAAPTVDRLEVTCKSCNAHIQMPDNVSSMKCPYCSTPIVATGTSVKVLKPRSLLPFGIDEKKARDVLRGWLAGRWFAPSNLKAAARVDAGVKGVYVPYWTYDCQTTTVYRGKRGDHYYVTVGSGKNRTQQQRTRWRPASGTVPNTFDDVLVPGSASIGAERLHELEPWDLNSLLPYQDHYLSGFTSETYSVTLDAGFGLAQARMQPVIDGTVRSDIGGDVQHIDEQRSNYADITFKHILLPVWLLAYRYHNQAFQITVNARTGEVHGERPYSAWKISLAVIGGLIALGVVLYLLNSK